MEARQSDRMARAERICRFVIANAEPNGWRIPEHDDASLKPPLDCNHDRPADQFKPYGATIGHAFEWARLFLHLANSPLRTDRPSLLHAAVQLYDRAVIDGWAPYGAPPTTAAGGIMPRAFISKPTARGATSWMRTIIRLAAFGPACPTSTTPSRPPWSDPATVAHGRGRRFHASLAAFSVGTLLAAFRCSSLGQSSDRCFVRTSPARRVA